jgi:hypothetical protein
VNSNIFIGNGFYYSKKFGDTEKDDVSYLAFKFKHINFLKLFDEADARKYMRFILNLETEHRLEGKEFNKSHIVEFLKHPDRYYTEGEFSSFSDRKANFVANLYMKMRNN